MIHPPTRDWFSRNPLHPSLLSLSIPSSPSPSTSYPRDASSLNTPILPRGGVLVLLCFVLTCSANSNLSRNTRLLLDTSSWQSRASLHVLIVAPSPEAFPLSPSTGANSKILISLGCENIHERPHFTPFIDPTLHLTDCQHSLKSTEKNPAAQRDALSPHPP